MICIQLFIHQFITQFMDMGMLFQQPLQFNRSKNMEFINNFKTLVIQDTQELQSHRLSITQQELNRFWQNKTLAEMSQILTVGNDYIVNFIVSQLLPPYLTNKKIVHEAFIAYKPNDKGEEVPALYCYDCRIFRNQTYMPEQNQLISSFILCYKENIQIQQPIYQIVDVDELEPNRWTIKIKQSSILKTFTNILEYFKRLPFCDDKIILPQEKYYYFMQQWMKCYFHYNIQITVNNFFKGLLALFQNQILLQYFKTLTVQQKEERMYGRPIKMIGKPKNVEQFTLTQQHFGQISWQTLKIVTYKLKYRVEEHQDYYNCYRIKQQSEGGCQFYQLTPQDQNILLAFEQQRKKYRDYSEQYNNGEY